MKKIFEYIKADKFFPKYAPGVKNYKHKIRGKNGRGNPLEFTARDKQLIEAGLIKLFKNIV